MAARLSPAVYRRRRLVVFGALLAVAALLVAAGWMIASALTTDDSTPKAPTPGASSSTPPGPGATGSPSPEATEPVIEGIQPCAASDIEVLAKTDAEAYDPGVLPQLSISLTNRGAADCTLDVGTATQAFTIKSGEDVWWRSTDCQIDPTSMVVTLAAGATVPSATPVPWDRTRSSPDSCESPDRQVAPGGGSSYHLTVQIGGIESAGSAQFFLN